MLKLKIDELENKAAFENAGIRLPRYDVRRMAARTKEAPTWVHFGAGNIFRSFLAALVQDALNRGASETGLVAAESFDFEIADAIYKPYDNLSLLVKMHADGSLEKELIASVAECLKAAPSYRGDWERLRELFGKESLQVASFTITEKGYALRDMAGAFFPVVREDIENGPSAPRHAMSVATALAHARYRAGALPLAFLSLDNCSHNGERLRDAILTVAREWGSRGFVEEGFTAYLEDVRKVSFPWSMIDKITPHPAESVKKGLEDLGVADMDILVTKARTVIAPFVNAEAKEYLVVEDDFPAGRMNLAAPGVSFADRDTVEKAEKMKVGTCLNPIHTALALFGCLLGYRSIWEETRDADLQKLIERLTFVEGMPVVANPGVLDPVAFAREVIEERLPNPNIPDTPQRIAADTSQKVGIRFGETLRAYREREDRDPRRLVCIPLVIAAWFRYLLAVDDEGHEMALSPDPMLPVLHEVLAGVAFGKPETYTGQLLPILRNETLFHVNVEEMGLAGRIEEAFVRMLAGPGSVRKTLREYTAQEEKTR